jgi:hypothetical protein
VLRRCVVLTLLALGLWAPAAQSAAGVPFATADFNGTNGGQTYFTVYGAMQAAAHDNVAMRVTVISGELELNEGEVGAIWWAFGASVAAGTAPSFATRCQTADDACAFHVDWFDVADLPGAISGVITSGVDGESWLQFPSPIGGTYHAQVTLSSGSLVIEHNRCNDSTYSPINVTTSGSYLLGQYASGTQAVCLHAPDGESASWTVQFAKDPALVSAVAPVKTLIRPRDVTPFSYILDNPAYVTCWVTDSAGATVRTITASQLTTSGTRTQNLDGIDDVGRPLPDGTYTLHVGVIGDTASEGHALFTVDGTGPSITVPTRNVTTPRGGITIHVSDGGRAIASATISARGLVNSYSSVGNGTVTFNPRRDWISGDRGNIVLITATDAVGNATQLRQTITFRADHGRVDHAWMSRLPDGAPVASSFPHGTKALYASFHFGRVPAIGSGAITTTWYEPDGTRTPSVSKRRRSLVRAFVRGSAALPAGRWRCVLRIDGDVVREINVRVG